MSPIWGFVVAMAGVMTGLAWRFEGVREKEFNCSFRINHIQLRTFVDRIFIFTRPLGTKWFLISFLGFVLIWRTQLIGSLVVVSLLSALIERGIKIIIKRPRPFKDHEKIIVRQNPSPKDPSFPSGDATRIWFIFAAILFGFHPSLILSLLVGLCAVVVNFGRIRLGVHYPLDVWAGTGLGFGLGMVWSSFVL
jgi:undecaprenyl-diphosphatase